MPDCMAAGLNIKKWRLARNAGKTTADVSVRICSALAAAALQLEPCGAEPARAAAAPTEAGAVRVERMTPGEPLKGAMSSRANAPSYHMLSWSLPDGLPGEKVRALLQSRNGYLWVGTESGLARFDGLRFTVFDRKSCPEMVNDDCRALAEDGQGVVWIGTTGGLLRWADGVFTRFTTADGLPPGYVFAICVSRNGTVWIGCSSGLCRFEKGRLRAQLLGRGGVAENSISSLAEDESGTLWIGAGGLGELNPQTGDFVFHRTPKSEPVVALAASSSGGLHVFTQFGLYEFASRQWQRLASRDGPVEHSAFLVLDSANGIWAARASQGLELHRPGQAVSKSPGPFPPGGMTFSMLSDREGNLWMGTDRGLAAWLPRRVTVYASAAGLAHEDVQTIFQTAQGEVWIGTDGGLSRFNPTAAELHQNESWPLQHPDLKPRFVPPVFASLTETDGLIHNSVRTIAEDSEGALWIGTIRGVSLLRNGRFSPFPLPGQLGGNKIHAICRTAEGAMWMGSELGLHCWNGQRLTTLTQSSGLSHNHVRGLLPARDGALWVATYGGGVNRLSWPNAAFDKSAETLRSTSFRQEATLGPNSVGMPSVSTFTSRAGLSSDNTRTLLEDSRGAIWVGTDHGLNRITPERVVRFTMEHGLPDNVINQILEDDLGSLWIGTEHGIFTVSMSELEAVASARAPKASCIVYDRSDGLLIDNTSGQKSQPAACKTKDGQLWFSTQTGVVVIDPRTAGRNDVPPLVAIERFVVNDAIVFDNAGKAPFDTSPGGESRSDRARSAAAPSRAANTADLRLPPGHGRMLEIRFTATGLAAAQKNRFKYRLEGLEKGWTEAGTRRTAHYNALPPGAYHFRVIACNNHGVWNETGAALAFIIEPFFYQTWKFYGSCAAAVLALFAFVLWRERRIFALRGQVALQAQRERIARDIHEQLGARLTHLALTGDQHSESIGQHSDTTSATAASRQIAQEAVADLGDLVWTLDPRCDSLEALVVYLMQFAEELFSGRPKRCRFELPGQLPAVPLSADLRHTVLRLLRSILRDFAGRATSDEVVFSVTAEKLAFELVVRCSASLDLGSILALLNTNLPGVGGSFQLSGGTPPGTILTIRIPTQAKHD